MAVKKGKRKIRYLHGAVVCLGPITFTRCKLTNPISSHQHDHITDLNLDRQYQVTAYSDHVKKCYTTYIW